MRIKSEKFGKLKTGEEVIKYKMIKDNLEVELLNYGGIITGIYTPDKRGKKENIVLSFDNLSAYEESSPYLGAIIGRHAGRIEEAEFVLNGKQYQLTGNEGVNNLHGGPEGLDKKIWSVKKLENGLELNCLSPHLENGFPGKIEFKVKYLLRDSSLVIEYEAKPDRETIINLTNHSYFNLAADPKQDISNHKLKLEADKFLALDENSIPTGELREVAVTPFDFRKFKRIGNELEADYQQLKYTGGYDHPFVLAKESREEIILQEEETGRILKISTDQPIVVFYDGNQLADSDLVVNGIKAKKRAGLCLETQDYPNAVNLEEFPLRTYSPENIYRAKTEYLFGIID